MHRDRMHMCARDGIAKLPCIAVLGTTVKTADRSAGTDDDADIDRVCYAVFLPRIENAGRVAGRVRECSKPRSQFGLVP